MIDKPLILKNPILEYAWGSHSAIQDLMDQAPTDSPWAELWMGAHRKAPSQIYFNDKWTPLDTLIQKFPADILGKPVAKKFHNTLPYLFKILAADQPLSVQAHPNKTQAIKGFDRENKLQIPKNAPHRNYKDDQHKPEIICALTPFTGLKGFRNISSIIKMLETLCPTSLRNELEILKNNHLKQFFKSLFELPEKNKIKVIHEAVKNAKAQFLQTKILKWILKLYEKYPKDIGILSPVILNLFSLDPGQALFLPAGELHAYLDGLGIELMANSDNVLRGGLTPKHVDVSELLNVLNFTETKIDILLPQPISSNEMQYPIFASEFSLSKIIVNNNLEYASPQNRSVEILLCTKGSVHVATSADMETVFLEKGKSILIPAMIDHYQLIGDAELYKASVPLT